MRSASVALKPPLTIIVSAAIKHLLYACLFFYLLIRSLRLIQHDVHNLSIPEKVGSPSKGTESVKQVLRNRGNTILPRGLIPLCDEIILFFLHGTALILQEILRFFGFHILYCVNISKGP